MYCACIVRTDMFSLAEPEHMQLDNITLCMHSLHFLSPRFERTNYTMQVLKLPIQVKLQEFPQERLC